MDQFGKQLRKRAQELGLSDAEVARRASLSERRYGFYVSGDREPDLATLVRIATVLNLTPNDLLGVGGKSSAGRQHDRLVERLVASAVSLGQAELELLVIEAEAIARHKNKRRP